MLFDSAMLARISADLQCELIGCRIRRAIGVSKTEAALETTTPGPSRWLVLCVDPQFGRVHLSAEAQPRPDIHCPLADVLGRYLVGARLDAVKQIDFDRLLWLSFINAQKLGPKSTCTLVAEIMGRHSNVLLLDEEGIILECLKHVPAQVNRYRQSLPGLQYQPPPRFNKVNPFATTPAELADKTAQAAPDMAFSAWFRETFHGASNLFIAEVAAGIGTLVDTELSNLASDWEQRLLHTLADLEETITTPGQGYICRDSSSDTLFAYPFVPQSRPQLSTSAVASLSTALDQVYLEVKQSNNIRQLRQQLQAAAGKQLDHVLVRRHKREATLASVDDADHYRKYGELILAHLNDISPYAEEATVTDYYSEDQSLVTIPMAPPHPPQQVAEIYFKRSKRSQRLQERLPRLINVDRIKQDYLEGLLHQIESAQELAGLEELRQEMIEEDIIKPPKRSQPRPQKRRLPRFESSDGYLVTYGKTGQQNDEVVRNARPDDLWLHVQQGPGGHVVIRTGGKPQDVPKSTLLQAAAHAAALSRQSQSTALEVDYTLIKHLNKPTGGPPGFVYYRRFSTVRVAPKRAD